MKRISLFCFLAIGFVISASAAGGTEERPLFSFGVVTDVHYSAVKPVTGSRRYADSKNKLRSALDEFDRRRVNFVVSLGDLMDGDLESCAEVAAMLDSCRVPVFKVTGNHDYMGHCGSPEQQRVTETMGVERPYFEVVRNGFRLLFLDSNDCSLYGRAEDSPEGAEARAMLARLKADGAPNARAYNAAIGAAQQAWIAGRMDEARMRNEKVICLTHMPLTPFDSPFTLWNNREVARLLQESPCVKAFIAGHHHKGGRNDFGSVRHVTLCGMIEGGDNAYAIVDVYADRLEINGYGRQQSMTLEFIDR